MSKNVHVGLVLPSVPGYSETFFRNKIVGLQKSGIRVTLFATGPVKDFSLCPYYPQPPTDRLFPFRWLKILNFFFLVLVFKFNVLRRLFLLERTQKKTKLLTIKTILTNSHILRHRLDWLHFGFGTMVIGRENLAKAIGAKMAVSFRGFDIAIYPLKHTNCYQHMWGRLDKLHVISNDLKNLAIKNGLPSDIKFHVINPAIDIKKFNCSRPLNEVISRPLKLLTVARLHWKKGLDYTLYALALLHNQGIAFNYSIIGEGEEYERLVFTSYQLGISEHVHFIGKQSPDAVKQAMNNCDIYLQYSISEGFCNAVLEAQAMGCLCIVSDAEGLSENVLDGVTGWVVPKGKPENLASTLIHIETVYSGDIQKFRQNAISRVREEFNLQKQMEEFYEFYTT